MKARKKGHRYPLLVYRMTMDRMWRIALPFLVIMILMRLASARNIPGVGFIPYLGSAREGLLMFTIVALGVFTVFVLIFRSSAYVQPMGSYLLLSTPFLRLKISYRRIMSVRPSDIAYIFTGDKKRQAAGKVLKPFFGLTGVALEMKGYPLSRSFLSLMLGKWIFLPYTDGFLLVVSDWMALSTEIDSYRSSWLQGLAAKQRGVPPSYALLQSLRKK